jgi:hypothetical protein
MDSSERTQTSKTPEQRKKPWLKYAVLAAAIVVIAVIVWVAFAQRARSEVPAELKSAKTSSSYPLYYPQSFPEGLSLVDKSLSATSSAVMFSVKDASGNTMIVTEQPRPALTEEVKKTKQFSAPAGSAFLAQVNNRTIGFIHADKTLIIVSPTGNVADDQLVKLLSSLQKL